MECLAMETGAFKSCSIVDYTTDCVLFVLIDTFSHFFLVKVGADGSTGPALPSG